MAQQGFPPAAVSPFTSPTLADHHPLRCASDYGDPAYEPYLEDIVIDPIQARLYNWLNGPTTLNHAEINSLVNNITFIIRSLQRNTKSSAGIDFSNVHDSDLHVVTAAENGGFRMSIFFGNYLICMGEHVDRREQTMDGLREKVEKMISSIVNIKAKAIKKHQHEDSQITLQDGDLPGSGLVNGSLGSDGAVSGQCNGTAEAHSHDLLPPGDVSTPVTGSAPPGVSHEMPTGTSMTSVPQSPLSGPSLLHGQGQFQDNGHVTYHSQP